ncbi:AMP-dependent synthetase and ligase [Acidovorax delafieldii 2AN]|uniref:AMP-dependent synthetase and ligase n=2 Tax=Acidovorax delafieldii TaxID=47920 RepID=C5T0A2_ACIDE|nr:AMP-dependent synthetase and ligase [Acidovorax delafieldii 2AN]
MVGGATYSYGEVWTRACKVAAGLRASGVGPGDAVVILLPNGPDAVFAWLGANVLGAIDVTINSGYRGASFEHALNQVRARVLIMSAESLPLLRASEGELQHLESVFVLGLAEVQGGVDWMPWRFRLQDYDQAIASAPASYEIALPVPSDIASVIYTSGTTGAAKGVMMPHAQVVLLARQTAKNFRIGPDDIYYSFHPLYHMAGKFMQVLACAAVGAKLVLDNAFDPAQWLQRVRDSGATLSGAHGPMLEMIFAQPDSSADREHQLRAICSAPFPRHIAAAFEARFGVRGIEVWGMTEVGIPLWCSFDEPLREGSCGRVDGDWFDFCVVDPSTDRPVPTGQTGEFVVRNKHPWTLMQGYIGMPDKTVEAWRNLWFHTGDSGYMDESGNVYFVDRTSDRIRRRAENIASYDIEVAALQHPFVAEAAAVGTPSEFASDDDIRLCVVLHPGMELLPQELLGHLAGLLPHFMVPRYIEQLDELPRSATHKVQRGALRRRPLGPRTWDRKAHGVSLRTLIHKE